MFMCMEKTQCKMKTRWGHRFKKALMGLGPFLEIIDDGFGKMPCTALAILHDLSLKILKDFDFSRLIFFKSEEERDDN